MVWFLSAVCIILSLVVYSLWRASNKAHANNVSLLAEINSKNIILERASQALELSGAKVQELSTSIHKATDEAEVSKRALEFQQAQYEKLIGQKKSSEVRTGKIVEQISPFLADYPMNPDTARFIGEPIDFVHFDEDKVTFVEVKSGKSQLSKKQRNIRDLIKGGKVDFIVYRIEGEDEPSSS